MKEHFYPILLLLISCATHPPLKKVETVDLKRFMGKWYVIANIPTFIEKGGTNAIETYTWNEKDNRIDVVFKQVVDGKEKTYTQKAFVHDPSGNEWRIQFFWPLKFPYLIIDLAPDYSYTVITVPNRSYVWIMAREKTLPEETYELILKKLKEQHFDLSEIKKVPQT
jgi:apolipoprotein D and lipocalin family protein